MLEHLPYVQGALVFHKPTCILFSIFLVETPVSESPMGLYNRKKELVRARSDSKEEFRNVPRMSQVCL